MEIVTSIIGLRSRENTYYQSNSMLSIYQIHHSKFSIITLYFWIGGRSGYFRPCVVELAKFIFFEVFVTPDTGEVRRLELASLADSGTPGVMCGFVINKNGAEGQFQAELHTPSKKIYPVQVLPTAENDLYCGRFMPFEVFFSVSSRFYDGSVNITTVSLY